jgi:K+-sensing histidine kinase KdpD
MLRSPVGAIVILTAALRERGDQMTAEQRDDHLGIVYRAALGVSEMAGNLLTLVGNDVPEVSAGPFSPKRVLGLIADVVRPMANVRECGVTVSAPDEAILAQESTIARVMLGLTLRAVERTRGGVVRLTATMESPRSVRFAVTRQGVEAVPRDGVGELMRIFRLVPETGDTSLSPEGLGLTAVERLLRSIGSTLRLETIPSGSLRLAFDVTNEFVS